MADDLPCLSITVSVYNVYGPSVEQAESIARDAMDEMKYQFGRLMPDRDDEDVEYPLYEVMDANVSVTVD